MEWIPINEQLPEEKQIVLARQENEEHPEFSILLLAFENGSFLDIKYVYAENENSRLRNAGAYPEITHWMPLPTLPTT